MAYTILRHLAFNEWANTQLAEMLVPVDDVIYYQENKSNFPSIVHRTPSGPSLLR